MIILYYCAQISRARSGTLTVALDSGQTLSIPASKVTFNPHTKGGEEEDADEETCEEKQRRETALALGNLRYPGTTHSGGATGTASPTTRR